MCGIVGYTGPKNAPQVIVGGLYKLEYRGYDSAGIAFFNADKLNVIKVTGRVESLDARISDLQQNSHTGIGHTRWATHGKPNVVNAHPHCDSSGRIALVHNGIIENYSLLRQELAGTGARFLSETDSEAAAILIGQCYQGDLVQAVERAIKRMEGTFAFAVISLDHPGLLVGARRGSPLAVGLGTEDGECFWPATACPFFPIRGE